MPPETSRQLREFVIGELGADLFGICSAEIDLPAAENLRQFTSEGLQGEMHYLENHKLRSDPAGLLPGVQSVLVLGINYYRPKLPTPAGQGRVARYAWGRDYHKIFQKILRRLITYLEENYPGHGHRLCVDSAPLMEKVYARRAGLGFYGKNGVLINSQLGSFFLLGEVLTTLELAPLTWPATDTASPSSSTATSAVSGARSPGCGTCTRCLDACPTAALIAPGRMDARRCISYLTIENRAAIPAEFSRACGNLIMGCDICQEVCPYNLAHARPASHREFTARPIAGDAIPLEEILQISDDRQFLERFAGSPLMRPKREGMIKNALNAAANAIREQPENFRPLLLPLIEKIAATDDNPRLRTIAADYLRLLTR